MKPFCCDLSLYLDGYHFREDSQSRRKLIAGLAHRHTAFTCQSRSSTPRRPFWQIGGFSTELQNNHRFALRGRYLVDSRALTDSLRKLARTKPTKAQEQENPAVAGDQPDPWEDEWFETKREEILLDA